MTSNMENILYMLNNPHPVDWVASYCAVSSNYVMTCFVIYVHYLVYKYGSNSIANLYRWIHEKYNKILSLVDKLENLGNPQQIPPFELKPVNVVQEVKKPPGISSICNVGGSDFGPSNMFEDVSGLEIPFYEKLQKNSLNNGLYGPDGFVYDEKDYYDFMFGPDKKNLSSSSPFMTSDIKFPTYDVRKECDIRQYDSTKKNCFQNKMKSNFNHLDMQNMLIIAMYQSHK